MLFTQTLYLKI